MIASPHGPRCIATEAVADENRPPHPGPRSQAPPGPALRLAALQVMPVQWTPAADYDDRREEAEQRIAARDPDYWPTVALALKLGLPVWSQDKDLTTAGLDVLHHRRTARRATRRRPHPVAGPREPSVTPITHATPSIHAACRVPAAENDGLGDELLLGVAQRRVVVVAIVADERVRELVAEDVDAGVDGLL